MFLISTTYWQLKTFVSCNKGEISIYGAIGFLLILVAYFVFPDAFHSFFRNLINTFINTAHDSFQGKDSKQTNYQGSGKNKTK